MILITTKKGEKGSRPRVTYDGNVSISTKTKSIDVMGADEYRNFVTDRFGAESSAVKLLGKEKYGLAERDLPYSSGNRS